MKEIIKAKKITKTYTSACGKQHHVLTGVSLAVREGEIVCVMGESGSGKSTLVKILAGLVRADSGTVFVDGVVHTSPDPSIQMVFQDALPSFNRYRTIGDSIAEGAIYHDTHCSPERMAMLVGLDAHLLERLPSQLSGGQVRRAALARAIAMKPRVLLADELTSGLDLTVQAGLLNLLVKLAKEENIAILLVCHDAKVVRHLADYVVIIAGGQVAAEGTVDNLTRRGIL